MEDDRQRIKVLEEIAAKYLSNMAVKAVGDWKVEIKAVPYGTDGDTQTFDADTDYMEDDFKDPLIIYQHGIKPGSAPKGMQGIATGESLEAKPVVIGKSIGVEKRSDGVYITAILDKTKEYARRVWEAAKKGLAVASSDSISHLARLDVGNGREIMYEKTRPGRVTVWPLAGVSLWDAGNGNFPPASRNAYALPAMKAIYREAGLEFPDINLDTTGDAQATKRAQRRTEIMRQSQEILRKDKQWRNNHG
jgi:hypothetical protein